MDMSKAYRDIARAFFPSARIGIDRLHVVRYGLWAFEGERRRIQKPSRPENANTSSAAENGCWSGPKG